MTQSIIYIRGLLNILPEDLKKVDPLQKGQKKNTPKAFHPWRYPRAEGLRDGVVCSSSYFSCMSLEFSEEAPCLEEIKLSLTLTAYEVYD